MPWWQRQRGSQVFVFYRKDGRIRALPRSQTRHLDSLNDTAIEFWLAEWAQGRIQACSSSRKLRGYVDRYCGYLEQRGKAPKTVWEHRHSLIEHVLPFFLDGDAPLVDPNQWPAKSIRLHAYVTKERGRSDSCSRKAINALQHFYNFLVDEGVVYTGMPLRIRSPVRPSRLTPLQYALKPSEVLEFSQSTNDARCSLLAVIGYFFSLRTFELMALRPCDFSAGSAAKTLECCRVMARYGLFDRLAVDVHRQRDADGAFRSPKCRSFGVVACFSAAAATWLVPRLNAFPRDELIFPRLPDVNINHWRKYGIPQITLKDLRRSSLYHLGHYTDVDLVPLKNHARHRYASTTEEYLRRPRESIVASRILDLET